MENRQVILAERPVGMINDATTKLIVTEAPVCGPDEALVKVGLVSIDPAMRGWMDDVPSYLPPIAIGEVIRSGGGGVVVESNSARYQVGDVVYGQTNWQEWVVASEQNTFTVLSKDLGVDLATAMGALGMTGLTAYFGLLEVGQFKVGDVVLVSGAGGATGSVAGQIAKARGAAKVVGIAGGPEKCAEVVKRYGFDECLDYKEPRLRQRIREACPSGVDLYFDNVGGEILDDALANIALRARVVLCGAISQYNAIERHGVANTPVMIGRRGHMEGFIVFDFAARYAEAQAELATMVLDGTLAHQEHLVYGLERAPDALNLLFSGGNHGKTLVVVDESVTLA